MKRLLVILPLLLLLFSCGNYRASRGPADWIYVSETGSDVTGNGTIGSPFATVSHACSTASSGDTVYVMPGTINQGTTQIVKPVGVSIYGAGPASHIVSTYTSGSAAQAAIQCASTVGTTTNDGGSISYIRLTGSNLTSTKGIYVGYRNNVAIHHVTLEDFLNGGIWLHVSNNYLTLYASGNSITDCVIINCAQARANYQGAIRISGQTNCDVLRNAIDMTKRPAGNNGSSIEFQRSKKTRIDDNIMYRLDHELDWWNFFFEGWDYSGDFEYTNNTHYGLAKVSFGGEYNRQESDCNFGFKAIGNRFFNPSVGYRTVGGYNQAAYCICVEGNGHVNGFVQRNYIQNYGIGIELSTPSSGVGYWAHYWNWDNITVSYNVIDGVGYQDWAYSYGIWWINETNLYPYYGVFNNITIANNTIRAHDGVTYDGYQGIGIYANDTINNLRISNNIATGFSNYGIYIAEHSTDTLVIAGLDATYNCMNGNGTNSVYVESSATRITITDSDVTTGNITSDPLFRSSGFRLQSTSPAINAGLYVGLTTDFAGHRVPQQDTVDIGAYEYGDYLFRTPSGHLLRNANGKLMITH